MGGDRGEGENRTGITPTLSLPGKGEGDIENKK
jgi:hypothetical protein